MQKLILIFFILSGSTLYAQQDYHINTVDSIISTDGAQGVYGLSSVEYGGDVHLAYYYGTTDGKWYLIHEVRREGQRLSREEVYQFSDNPWVGGSTGLQFDEDGNVYIYCAFEGYSPNKFSVFSSKDQWTPVHFPFTTCSGYVSSHSNGSQGLGCVTYNCGFGKNETIIYFGQKSGLWGNDIISETEKRKSKPVTYQFDGVTYVSYAEAGGADTVVLYVHKLDRGIWSLDQRFVYPKAGTRSGGFGFTDWVRMGDYNGQLHLVHNMDKSTTAGSPRHLVKSGGAWREIDYNNREDYVEEGFSGDEIQFDSKGNIYWVGRDAIRTIDHNNTYQEFKTPRTGAYYGYYDFAILNDAIYLYFGAGNKSFPHGDALICWEAIGSLSDLTNTTTFGNTQNMKVMPNPGHGRYRLQIDLMERADIIMTWYDMNGKQIGGQDQRSLPAGLHDLQLTNGHLNKGLYMLRVSTSHGTIATIPITNM